MRAESAKQQSPGREPWDRDGNDVALKGGAVNCIALSGLFYLFQEPRVPAALRPPPWALLPRAFSAESRSLNLEEPADLLGTKKTVRLLLAAPECPHNCSVIEAEESGLDLMIRIDD